MRLSFKWQTLTTVTALFSSFTEEVNVTVFNKKKIVFGNTLPESMNEASAQNPEVLYEYHKLKNLLT